MIKLALIGSGSMVFTRRIVTDLLLDKNLSGMEIALMDIDSEKLRVSELIVNLIVIFFNRKQVKNNSNIIFIIQFFVFCIFKS